MAGASEDRERRVALNESLVRDVNERIGEGAQRFDIKGRTEFLCECASDACSERIRLTLDEYHRVRERPDWFILAPGHEVHGAERVVEQADGYVIVEKVGAGRDVADDLDPRS